MLKLISLVLSFSLIVGSVTPSLAQVAPRRMPAPKRVGLSPKFKKSSKLPSVAAKRSAKELAVLKNMRVSMTPRHTALLSPEKYVPTARKILTHQNPTERAMLLRSDFTVLALNHEVSTQDMAQGVAFYRENLKQPMGFTAQLPQKTVEELYTSFNNGEAGAIRLQETLADVSALGLLGTHEDAPAILEVYQQTVGTVAEPLMTLVAARALLRLEGYEELTKMAAQSTQHPDLWEGISVYLQLNEIPVPLPQVERAVVDVAAFRPAMEELGELSGWLLNPALEATFIYINAGRELESKAAVTEEMAPKVKPAEVDLAAEVALSKPATVTPAAEQPVEAAAQPATRPVSSAPRRNTDGIVYSSILPISPNIFQRMGNWMSNLGKTNKSARIAANKQARYTLSMVQPVPTSLKAILDSEASESYKQEALLHLYAQGKLGSAITALPKTVQDKLTAAADDIEQLKTVLYSLYYSGSLQTALDNLLDHPVQVNWEADLSAILNDPSWASKALTAYSSSQVLPSSDPENFEGVVPSVPEVKQKEILSTFRPTGFAVSNLGTAVEKKNGLYYENRIPFYYRYADGTLSAHPVGILSQERANRYGRMLSALHLASKQGFTVPKGFVLALDESGQWKFLPAAGELSTIEQTPASMKILQQIRKEGSYRVALDTPYTSSDLLSIANMLENQRDLNLELVLNTPHSLKQYLKLHAFFIGNDAGMSLAGPFTKMLKNLEGLGATMANAVSGVGYLTPWIAGWAMPLMTKLGNVKTIQYVYGAAAAALAVSAGMGMFWAEPVIGGANGIPLGVLAVPTVAMVLGASLLNSFNNTLLNFFKDPATRTAAHLSFAENKQWSRLALTGATAGAAALGGSWAIVVPVGLGLLGMSELLFLNTPIYKNRAHQEKKEEIDPQKYAAFKQAYKQQIRKLSEVKDINFRVKMVYASYAASLMALSQGATEILGTTWGPIMAAVFMLGTAFTRKGASKAIEKNKLTDDQMTGVSLPLLATTGAALAFLPYSGALAIVTAITGILHYVATATPGQMDAARLQNIVSAEMQKQKAQILADDKLSAEEKKTTLAELASQEKVWASLASKDYSFANGHGLAGIAVAAGAAYLFRDLGPQWTKDMLGFISDHTVGTTSDALGLARLIFAYSASMAGVLAWKNRALFKDFMQVFHKQQITQANISAGKISPSTFGMNSKNVAVRLVNVEKTMKKLQDTMILYGISSEQKLTQQYQGLVESYNRLVAAKSISGNDEMVAPYFDKLVALVKQYEKILDRNDNSIMLQRAFDQLKNTILLENGTLNPEMPYVEEGTYNIPAYYDKYEESKNLIHEIKQLVSHNIYGGQVTVDTYTDLIKYYNRVQQALPQYKAANMADSPRVLAVEEELRDILRGLKSRQAQLNVLDENAGPTSPENIQALKDLLEGIN